MGDPAYRDREKWTNALNWINNTFDCRDLIASEYSVYSLETRDRAEAVLTNYSNIAVLFPKDSEFPSLNDFGIYIHDVKYSVFLNRVYPSFYRKVWITKEMTLQEANRLSEIKAIKYYLQNKIVEGATRGQVDMLIRKAIKNRKQNLKIFY
jgi:hypothetical protein